MYSQEVITLLNNRLGWLQTSEPDFNMVLTPENTMSNSGRNFQAFHFGVSLTNLYYSHEDEEITEIKFNEYLKWMREQVVLSVLNRLFRENTQCSKSIDYSENIIQNPLAIDEAIGLCMAIKSLEACISSTNSNRIERIGKSNYSKFKSELEGYFDGSGNLVVKGLRQKYDDAIGIASINICGVKSSVNINDKTDLW